MMISKKKDKDYMAILDKPIEELKKPFGQSVDFEKTITLLLKDYLTQHKNG